MESDRTSFSNHSVDLTESDSIKKKSWQPPTIQIISIDETSLATGNIDDGPMPDS